MTRRTAETVACLGLAHTGNNHRQQAVVYLAHLLQMPVEAFPALLV